jgi:carbonic anhydrase
MQDKSASNPDKMLHNCDRRQVLATLGTAGTLLATPLAAEEPRRDKSFPRDAAEALVRLKLGNTRFVEGKTRHAHQSADWRKQLVGVQQQPFATILSCSDSRAPTELVFDQGVGDLFIIRVAFLV